MVGSQGWPGALCPSLGTLREGALSSESPGDGPLSDSDEFLDALLISLSEEVPELTDGRTGGLCVFGPAPDGKGGVARVAW